MEYISIVRPSSDFYVQIRRSSEKQLYHVGIARLGSIPQRRRSPEISQVRLCIVVEKLFHNPGMAGSCCERKRSSALDVPHV
jgi:hypothetical protein